MGTLFIEGDSNSVKSILLERLKSYPILFTRDLKKAKSWLKKMQGFRRVGLIESSGGRRLRPYGLDVTSKITLLPGGKHRQEERLCESGSEAL